MVPVEKSHFVRGARVPGDEPEGAIRDGGALYKNPRKLTASDADLYGPLRIAGEEFTAKGWWQPGRDGVRYLKIRLVRK